MTTYSNTNACITALPMWRRDAIVSAVISFAKLARKAVAASHVKGHVTTSEVD